jgi:hypothetical protein
MKWLIVTAKKGRQISTFQPFFPGGKIPFLRTCGQEKYIFPRRKYRLCSISANKLPIISIQADRKKVF